MTLVDLCDALDWSKHRKLHGEHAEKGKEKLGEDYDAFEDTGNFRCWLLQQALRGVVDCGANDPDPERDAARLILGHNIWQQVVNILEKQGLIKIETAVGKLKK